jgi:hypothetical protein
VHEHHFVLRRKTPLGLLAVDVFGEAAAQRVCGAVIAPASKNASRLERRFPRFKAEPSLPMLEAALTIQSCG